MNKRIKELVKQAGGHFSTRNLMSNPVQHRESIELWDDKIEKFSNLLIQECITVLNEDDGATHHTELLKQHFGVKE